MRGRIIRGWKACLAVSALLAMGVAPASAQSLLGQPKYAALLMDADTGEILYSRQSDIQRHPASITKVMTLYMLFERLAAGTVKLDDRIVISRYAAGQPPSKLGLPAGQSLSVDEAIRALTTKSANDVAVAVAEHVAGSEQAFGELMTRRAHQLGMTNSRFVNPHGLTNRNHVTTARDISLLSIAVLRNFPQYYHYFRVREFVHGRQVMPNHNHLLRTMAGVDGIKTGFTNAAGFTLAASAMQDGRRLVAVVLGSPTRVARDANVETLLKAGFNVIGARGRGQYLQVADLLSEPGDLNDALLNRLVEQGSADQGSATPAAASTRRP